MSLNSDSKNWWETQLEWNLAENLQNTLEQSQRMLKNIPATMSAHKLNKPSKIYELEADPIEKIKYQAPNSGRKPVVSPPPKPVCLQPKPVPAPRAVNMPRDLKSTGPSPDEIVRTACDRIIAQKVADAIDTNHLTLSQLLDPEFCDYT